MPCRRRAPTVEWVTLHDAGIFLRRLDYSDEVKTELGAWLARIMNTWFVAGVRTARYGRSCMGVAIDRRHVERMLHRMGYLDIWASELAEAVMDQRARLHEAGQQKAHIFAEAVLAAPASQQVSA